MTRGYYLTAAIAVALLLTGCMTSPPTPSEHYYRLQPAPVAEADAQRPPLRVNVQRFTADGLLRERAMLYSEDAGHRVLKQHSYHFWMDSPTRMLHDYWTARLQEPGRIQVAPAPGQKYALHGRVRRMERLLSENRVAVALSLELLLRDAQSREIVMQRRYDVIEQAGSDRIVDSVRAYEAALQRIYSQFTADLVTMSSHAANVREKKSSSVRN